MSVRRISLLAVVLAVPQHLAAQELRGTVRDSATGQPVGGVVVSLLNAESRSLGRNISDYRGQYRVAVPEATTQLRFVRIGFRPQFTTLTRSGGTVDTLDVVMRPIPTMLEPVTVRVNASCPRRSDQGPALGLLEQARASLLNSIVSREANPVALVRLTYERAMEGMSNRVARQIVRIDSAERTSVSFNAAGTAAEFVETGFAKNDSGGIRFFAPDAEVLLDDDFLVGYCFRLVKPERDRPTEVGLAFNTPNRPRGRVDIDGLLWVDTTSRQLRQLEFKYIGLDRMLEVVKPGGFLSFREMPNGMTIIDRWSLRMPALGPDSLNVSSMRRVRMSMLQAQESGGEIAHVELPAPMAWEAPLGSLSVRLTRGQKPAVGTTVRLVDTDYRARADSNGDVVINRLLPGPYTFAVIDSQLAPLDISLATPVRFNAARESVHRATLEIPTLEDTLRKRCQRDVIWLPTMPRLDPDVVWMLGKVVGPDGKPLEGVTISVAKGSMADIPGAVRLANAVRSTPTEKDGIFQLCHNSFHVGDTVRVQVDHPDLPPVEFLHTLTDSLTLIPLVRLQPRRQDDKVANGEAPDQPTRPYTGLRQPLPRR